MTFHFLQTKCSIICQHSIFIVPNEYQADICEGGFDPINKDINLHLKW